jgi:hypothetical protein
MFVNAATWFSHDKIFELMPKWNKYTNYSEKQWYFTGMNELHLTMQIISDSISIT